MGEGDDQTNGDWSRPWESLEDEEEEKEVSITYNSYDYQPDDYYSPYHCVMS